jgi:pimeloyl-ACP methyl ester carboxylesterase
VATFVVVHGQGSGGWLWDLVSDRLGDAGHAVYAPTLVGVGERASEGGPDTNLTAHVDQIVSLIQEQGAPRVVLAGFSYGGLPAEGAAAAIPDRIAQLVLIDAVRVPEGSCGFDAFPTGVADEVRAAVAREGDGWKMPPNPLSRVGGIGSVEAGIRSSDIERTLVERRGTHPIGTMEEPRFWDDSSLAGVSRCYVICTDKPSPVGDSALRHVDELRDAGFTVHDLATGHFPMLSMPKALTEILLTYALADPGNDD